MAKSPSVHSPAYEKLRLHGTIGVIAMVILGIGVFFLATLWVPLQHGRLGQATQIFVVVGACLAYVAITATFNLYMQRLIRGCTLSEALELAKKTGLSRRQREDFIRAERWAGELRRLDPEHLEVALTVLSGPMWQWVARLPKTYKIRADQVVKFFRTLTEELPKCSGNTALRTRARKFAQQVSEVLPEWEGFDG